MSLPASTPDLFETLFDFSPAATVFYSPVRDAAGTVIDLAFARLNPAAQQLLSLPAQPTTTYLRQFPGSVEAGLWEFHREAFLAPEGQRRELRQAYQVGGHESYYQLAAQRTGQQLLVSFFATPELPHAQAEQHLRATQAREQAALAEAEAERLRLRQVLQRMSANIALLSGPEHRYTLVNAEYERLFPGRPLLGRTIREVIPELEGQGFYELFDQVYQTGEPFYTAEAEVEADFAGDGTLQRRYYRTHFEPIRNAQGEVAEVLNFAVDITAQVEARQQLHQQTQEVVATRQLAERQQELLHALFEQAPVAIALFQGEEARVASANPLMAALWGRTPAQVVGKLLTDAVPELRGQGFDTMIAEVHRSGIPYVGSEAPAQILQDGRLIDRYYNFSCQPIYDAQGELLGVINVGTEVTEQVESRRRIEALSRETEAARAAAERQRNLLQALLTQAPVAIGLFQGEDVRVTAANPMMAALWGYTPEQVLGRPLLEGVPELRGQGFDDLLRQVLHTHVPVTGTEAPATMLRDGQLTTTYYNFVYQPLYDEQGQVLGVIDVAVDVTEQVEARRQLEQLNQELENRVAERTAQLTVQQGLLARILAQVPAGVATLNGPEHHFTFFNTAYAALAGRRPVLGQTVAEVFPEAASQGFLGWLDQVYATGQPFTGSAAPVELRDPLTGEVQQRYVDFAYQPLPDGQGRTQGILAFIVDVTEKVLARRQAETMQAALLAAAQRQAQQRQDLYQVFEQTPVAILLLREPDHRIDYFNAAFAELFPPEEWTGGSIRGHAISEVYPSLRGAGLSALLDRVFATGDGEVLAEMPLAVLQPGSPRYVTFAYQAYREQERIVGVAAFIYDVTEQVLARQERATQQQLVETVFEQAPVGIWVVRGADYVFELVNPLMTHIIGASPQQALGRPYFEVLPELLTQGIPELLAQVQTSGEPVLVEELAAQLAYHGPGETGYFTFVFTPLRDAQGNVARIACVALEVSSQVQARQQVQQLNDALAASNTELHATNQRLERTNADLDTFVYTASHDLKTPITNVEGLLLALRDTLPEEVQQQELVAKLLRLLDDTVGRFRFTITQLTDLVRLQQTLAGAAELVPLAALVAEVQTDLGTEIELAQATVQVDVAPGLRVRFAPASLRSIVYNLLSNALKYRAPERPAWVQVRAEAQPEAVLLHVQDNGLGLTDSQQQRLFQVFQRLHTHVEGTGVGLYMIKRLIENAGSTISVRSELGVGTTFTVRFPA